MIKIFSDNFSSHSGISKIKFSNLIIPLEYKSTYAANTKVGNKILI